MIPTQAHNYKDALDEVYELARKNKFSGLFNKLLELSDVFPKENFAARIKELNHRYYYMLQYLNRDKQMNVEFFDIEMSTFRMHIFKLIEDMMYLNHVNNSGSNYRNQINYNRLRPEETLETLIADYLGELKNLESDVKVFTDTRRRSTLERLATDIFNRLRTLRRMTDDEASLVESILSDTRVPEYDRQLWLSALGLGLVMAWDPEDRFFRILESLKMDSNMKISIVVQVWALMYILRRNSRYDESILEFVNDHIDEDVKLIIKSFIKFHPKGKNNTELTGNKDVKLNLSDLSKINLSGNNPLDNISSEQFEALKSLNEAQMNGDDLMGDMFATMANLPFFSTVANWLLPFYSDHSQLAPIVDGGDGVAYAELLQCNPSMCDVDRFAMALSVATAPDFVKNNMGEIAVNLMNQLMSDTESMEALENIKDPTRAMAISSYVKNLARLSKYYRCKEFEFLFDDLDLSDAVLIFSEDERLDLERMAAERSLYDIFHQINAQVNELAAQPEEWMEDPIFIEHHFLQAYVMMKTGAEKADYLSEFKKALKFDDFRMKSLKYIVKALSAHHDEPQSFDFTADDLMSLLEDSTAAIEDKVNLVFALFNIDSYKEACDLAFEIIYNDSENLPRSFFDKLLNKMEVAKDYKNIEMLLDVYSKGDVEEYVVRGIVNVLQKNFNKAKECFEEALTKVGETYTKEKFYQLVNKHCDRISSYEVRDVFPIVDLVVYDAYGFQAI